MRRWMVVLCLVGLALAAGCGPAPASPAPAGPAAATSPAAAAPATAAPAATAPSGPVPGELVKFSGEDFAASDPFQLAVEAAVEISWEHAGDGQFALWLINDTEELDDPSLARVLVKDVTGSTQEAAQFTLAPGEYHLEVEVADGPWTVLVRRLD